MNGDNVLFWVIGAMIALAILAEICRAYLSKIDPATLDADDLLDYQKAIKNATTGQAVDVDSRILYVFPPRPPLYFWTKPSFLKPPTPRRLPTMISISKIAMICHETNRVYCQAIGDHTQKAWISADQWQRDSAIDGVRHHLKTLRDGGIPTPESSHENWMRTKEADGWTYGEIKDPNAKKHPCMVPYENLPAEQRLKDSLFISIVTTIYTSTGVQDIDTLDAPAPAAQEQAVS